MDRMRYPLNDVKPVVKPELCISDRMLSCPVDLPVIKGIKVETILALDKWFGR